jgi:hypothetical protein
MGSQNTIAHTSVKEAGEIMTDIAFFIASGWRNIWKHKHILLFSALPILAQLIRAVQIHAQSGVSRSPLLVVEGSISLALSFVSYVGVLYLAFCSIIDRPATVRETLFAVKKFSGRVLGFLFLSLIVVVPCFLFAIVLSTRSSTQLPAISNAITVWLLPLAVTSLIAQFVIVSFFANDWSMWQGVKEAWILFVHHIRALIILAVILLVVFRIYYTVSGVATTLIQSGFDNRSLSTLNYLDPSISLSGSVVFVLLAGAGQLIYSPLSASAFILAYFKYSGTKIATVAPLN